MPIYKQSEAKEGGWSQVREALQKFECDVISTEVGQWGGQLLKDDGTPAPAREFMEIKCSNVKVQEVSEELTMDIDGQEFSFRINCSMSKGSFWVDKFLASADKFKVLLPDGLTGKRVTFQKETLVNKNPKYNSTNYVIAGIAKTSPTVIKPATTTVTPATNVAEEQLVTEDPMEIALNLAVGKTEQQFRSAISLSPKFSGSPLLSLAKAGAITAALVKEGKLVEVKDGAKTIYVKPS